jgi:acyl phosphate:glycerol-3-phosphate acyltransferase
LLCDAGKAYGALWLIQRFLGFGGQGLMLSCFALLVGNSFSPLLNFSGGRGVATSLGICAFVLPWPYILLFMGLWLVILAVTKKPFIASLVSMAMVWGIQLYRGSEYEIGIFTFMFVWLVVQHRKHLIAWWQAGVNKEPRQGA